MKHIQLLGILALAGCFGVSCASKNKTASTNPYSSNPYYTNSSSSASSTEADNAGAAEYPTYTDSESYNSSNTVEYPSYSGGNTNNAPATPPAYPSYTEPAVSDNPNPYADTYIDPVIPEPAPTYNAPSYNNNSASSHKVAAGENLYRISLQYGTTVSAIQNANGLTDNTIHPGQVLRIP